MKTISSQRPQSYDRSFHSQVVSEKGASFYKISDGKNSAIPPRKVLKPVVASTEESYIDERPAFREQNIIIESSAAEVIAVCL